MTSVPGRELALAADPGGDEQGPNPVLLAHRALRGRYVLAVVLGLVLGCGAGAAGYFAIKPMYSSRAIVSIRPNLPVLVYETPENETIRNIDAFVAEQVSLLGSARVRDKAYDAVVASGVAWPRGVDGLIAIEEAMEITTPRRGTEVILTVEHEQGRTAQAVAQALIDAYDDIREDEERITLSQRESGLQDFIARTASLRDQKREQAARLVTDRLGVNDMEFAKKIRFAEIDRLNIAMAAIDATATPGLPDGAAGLTPVDPALARLEAEREQLDRALRSLKTTLSDQHREVRRTARLLEDVGSAIAARRGELGLDAEPDVTLETQEGAPAVPVAGRMEQLRARYDEVMQELQAIGELEINVMVLNSEADDLQRRYEEATQRKQQLDAESNVIQLGRVVTSDAELPLRPASDKRIQLGAAGFVGGMGLGVVSVAALGFFSPRIRVADDVAAAAPDVQILAMIPDTADPWGAASEAMDAVHLLRAMLDARLPDGFASLCVTSPTSGEGKSTVSYMLARSYAAAGRRVLLIDADLVGRRLSSRFGFVDAPGVADALQIPLADLLRHPDDIRVEFMPAGSASETPEEFCQRRLRQVLTAARGDGFDTAIIDTGPVLGSLDAAAAAPLVDQNLLIAARGVDSRPLRVAIARLRDLGASRVGIVFNRATVTDINRSASPSMSRRSTSALRSARPEGRTLPPGGAESAA